MFFSLHFCLDRDANLLNPNPGKLYGSGSTTLPLQVVRAGLDKGPEGDYEAERIKFGELVVTPEAKGLISLFHGQTECKKNHFGAPAKRSQTIGRKNCCFNGACVFFYLFR